jgi:hypothetical protein
VEYTLASRAPPGQLEETGGRVAEVVEHEGGQHVVDRAVAQRQPGHVADRRRWPDAALPGQHPQRAVHRDRAGADPGQFRAAQPGAGAGVKHQPPAQRVRGTADELGRQRPVHQLGAGGPSRARH